MFGSCHWRNRFMLFFLSLVASLELLVSLKVAPHPVLLDYYSSEAERRERWVDDVFGRPGGMLNQVRLVSVAPAKN